MTYLIAYPKMLIYLLMVVMFHEINSSDDSRGLQHDIDAIANWYNLQKMNLNDSKCSLTCLDFNPVLPFAT